MQRVKQDRERAWVLCLHVVLVLFFFPERYESRRGRKAPGHRGRERRGKREMRDIDRGRGSRRNLKEKSAHKEKDNRRCKASSCLVRSVVLKKHRSVVSLASLCRFLHSLVMHKQPWSLSWRKA